MTKITNRACQRGSNNALFWNSQTHPVNDSILEFQYFKKSQFTIALRDSCQHALFKWQMFLVILRQTDQLSFSSEFGHTSDLRAALSRVTHLLDSNSPCEPAVADDSFTFNNTAQTCKHVYRIVDEARLTANMKI